MSTEVDEEEVVQEEVEFVKGKSEIKPIPHDQTLTGWRIVPKGTRLLIRVVPKGERKSPQGIILPGQDESELEEVEVLAIGQGRYNQDRGVFMGSNYEPGDRGWMNRSAPHLMTPVPGRSGHFLIQEDLLQATLVEVEVDPDPFPGEGGGVEVAETATQDSGETNGREGESAEGGES